MNGKDFSRIIDQAFVPFLKGLGFVDQPKSISGRAYLVEFIGESLTLSVSFEPGDDYFWKPPGSLTNCSTPTGSQTNSRAPASAATVPHTTGPMEGGTQRDRQHSRPTVLHRADPVGGHVTAAH